MTFENITLEKKVIKTCGFELKTIVRRVLAWLLRAAARYKHKRRCVQIFQRLTLEFRFQIIQHPSLFLLLI